MLFWSELIEGGAALRQQVFLNAGIIARRKDGSKQGSIPIHKPRSKSFPALTNKTQNESFTKIINFALLKIMNLMIRGGVTRYDHTESRLPPSVCPNGVLR